MEKKYFVGPSTGYAKYKTLEEATDELKRQAGNPRGYNGFAIYTMTHTAKVPVPDIEVVEVK